MALAAQSRSEAEMIAERELFPDGPGISTDEERKGPVRPRRRRHTFPNSGPDLIQIMREVMRDVLCGRRLIQGHMDE